MLSAQAKVMLIGMDCREFTRKSDGEKFLMYFMTVKQDKNISTVGTTKEVYEMYEAGQIKDFNEYVAICTYNSNSRYLNVVGVHPVK